jgi:hypothetical protein
MGPEARQELIGSGVRRQGARFIRRLRGADLRGANAHEAPARRDDTTVASVLSPDTAPSSDLLRCYWGTGYPSKLVLMVAPTRIFAATRKFKTTANPFAFAAALLCSKLLHSGDSDQNAENG